MTHRLRRRLGLVLVLVASLLFQQVAIAAFVCPAPVAAPTMAHCKMMPPAPAPAPLCEKHCTPDQTVPSDAAIAQVVAPAIASMAFALVVHAGSTQHAPLAFASAVDESPPRTRYCRLLI